MANPLKSDKSTSLGLLLARLPIGVLFLVKGWDKWQHLTVTKFVAQYLPDVPRYMPPWFPKVYLTTLPYAEMAFGVFFITGFLTRMSGFFTSLMLISFVMVFGFRDANPDAMTALPFHPNFTYLAMTLLLFFAGPGRISVDNWLFGKKSPAKGNWN